MISSVVQLILGTGLLYYYIQFGGLFGCLVVVLSLPLRAICGHKIQSWSRSRKEARLEKLDLIENVLSNIREIKLGVWEGFFVSKILQVGKQERKWTVRIVLLAGFQGLLLPT